MDSLQSRSNAGSCAADSITLAPRLGNEGLCTARLSDAGADNHHRGFRLLPPASLPLRCDQISFAFERCAQRTCRDLKVDGFELRRQYAILRSGIYRHDRIRLRVVLGARCPSTYRKCIDIVSGFSSYLYPFLQSASAPRPRKRSSLTFTIVSRDHAAKAVSVKASFNPNWCSPIGIWRYKWGDGTPMDSGHINILGTDKHTYADWGEYTLTMQYQCYRRPSASTSLKITLTKPPEPTATPTDTPE